MGTDMLTFQDARSLLLSDVRGLSSERVPLAEAVGRVLAENLLARRPLPRFDHSAMDGYAVAAEDVEGDGPWTLRVLGESSAGRDPPILSAGAACRIFTGAALPERADAVLMQENVTRRDDAIVFDTRPKAGEHVRRAGEDLARGAVAMESGTRLSAGALALAAMLGRSELVVARRPRVTILCTGDELLGPGDDPRPASIPESNSAPLAALARQAGAEVRVAPIARDDLRELRDAINAALDGTDVLLTVGGVSVGDHDVVRPALQQAGITLDFWKVAVRPGKPLAVGRTTAEKAPCRLLGLPGNPSSAMVTFAMFGMPHLRAMQGDARPLPRPTRVRLATPRRRSTDRLELVRATLDLDGDLPTARVHDNQSSGAATSLAQSDGLAFIPPGDGALEAGTTVDFVRWSDV